MSIINNTLLLGSGDEGYNLTRSLRFRSSASAYLNRTQAAGTRTTWTWSGWVKLGLTGGSYIFHAGSSSGSGIYYDVSSEELQCEIGDGTTQYYVRTSASFRDFSSWYHVVCVADTTNATSADRLRIYVNGVRQTIGVSSLPTSSFAGTMCQSGVASNIGRFGGGSSYFDGYLAEVNFVDGQALTPSSFGETDTITGVWKPKRYAGTYGTNGFYLPFTDNSALTTSSNAGLGKDFSGNGNYWTTNNISITSGVTYDSMTDVPTLTSATAANFAVMNPLSNSAGSISNANLRLSGTSNATSRCNSTLGVSSGKWYFETTLTTAESNTTVGIGQGFITTQYPGQDALSYVQNLESASKNNNGSGASYGTSLTSGDVFMCAFDLDNLKLFFGKNGTWFNSSDPVSGANPVYSLTAGTYAPVARPYSTSAITDFNFGQRPFAYTPPSGFVALNTYNLPTSTIVKGNTVMDATVYSGNNATNTIVNSGGFKPDLIWIKDRGVASSHVIIDSVRGITKALSSDGTFGDTAYSFSQISSINSNGFTLTANATTDPFYVNINGHATVGWQWQAGQGTTSTNTSGTITSTVSANPSAGFSIVTFTGNGSTSSGQTVGHGLGVTPAMVITKKRSSGTTDYGWSTWHKDLGGNYGIWLDQTSPRNGSMWAGYTNINSTVFSPPDKDYGNESGQTYVAYCFAPIAGYSAFGSYTGNGSADGPFVYTNFRPKFVLLKRTDTTDDWFIYDTTRNTYNLSNLVLFPDLSSAEATGSSAVLDLLSNGFKSRGSGTGINASGGTYIYMAFAETPTKFALAR